jgi:hypothetical protein
MNSSVGMLTVKETEEKILDSVFVVLMPENGPYVELA